MKKIMQFRVAGALTAGLLLAGLAAAPLGRAADPEPKKEEAKPEAKEDAKDKEKEEEGSFEERLEAYSNWIEFSFGGLSLNGNRAALMQRHSQKRGLYGGVEDFHYQRSLDKKTTIEMDARFLLDNQDYKLRLDLVREDLGFIRGGYTAYRTWYDGSGGFFPPTGAFLELYDDVLAMDRGEFWVEGGLTLKKWPVLTLKYTNRYREGQADSTSWGLVHPYGAGPVRGISPTFLDIDQRRQIFEADARHTIGKVKFGAGVRYEDAKYDDARKIRMWPGEGVALDRRVTHRETSWMDTVNAHTFAESQVHKKVFLSGAYSYSTLDSDLAGSRIYGTDYDVAYVPALASALGFYNLSGGSQAKEHMLNLNLMYTPWPNLTLVPSFRVSKIGMDNQSWYIQTGLGPDAALGATSARDVLDLNEQLELRYTGLTNWVFYGRGEWMQGQGDITETGAGGVVPAMDRFTDEERSSHKYTLGVNWYLSRKANIDVQYYHKLRRNDYNHIIDSTPNTPLSVNSYSAFLTAQDTDTDDANIRLTLRPLKNVTLVSRYDFQYSTLSATPDAATGLAAIESGRVTSHIFAQNVTWVPWSRLYLQGGFNYVLSKTETPVDAQTQAVLDARNNYWNSTLTAGFVLDNKTDLQAQYYYYRAFDNYSDNSTFGVPYGANAKEHAITGSITRRLRQNILLSLKYGYFAYRDASMGGYNNYNAHLIYATMQVRF